MGRTFTNEARRAQIVRAAIEVIADEGYEQASFARITKRAGLSSPRMISYHFAGKGDLVRQIVTDVITEGATAIMERIKAQDTARNRLRAYLEANLEFLRAHPREMAALTAIGPHLRDEEGQAHNHESAQEPMVKGLAELLADGQRTGEFRDFDTRSMAVLIRGTVEEAARRVDSAFDFAAYIRELTTTIDLATRAGGDPVSAELAEAEEPSEAGETP